MTASIVDIANRALLKLGATRITALSDNIEQARVMASMFDIVRDDELRANAWSFSKARIEIAEDATPPAFGYTSRFLMPNDCLRVLMAGNILPGGDISWAANADDAGAWAIEGRYILFRGAGPLKLRYLRSVADTGLWDSSFVETFACRLAAEACEKITGSNEKQEAQWRNYATALRRAVRAKAVELPPRRIADDTWVTARMMG